MASTLVLAVSAAALVFCWAALAVWTLAERFAHDVRGARIVRRAASFADRGFDVVSVESRSLRRLAHSSSGAAAALCARTLVARDAAGLISTVERSRSRRRRFRALSVLVRGGSSEAPRLLRLEFAAARDAQLASLLRLAGQVGSEAGDALLLELLIAGVCPRSRTATELEPRAYRIRHALTRLTYSEEPILRFWGLTLLERQQDRELAGLAAAACVRDDDPSVRAAAAAGLGGLDARLAAPLLRGLLKDDVFFVRSHAARALGSLGDESLAPELLPLLADGDWWVRAAAKETLLALQGGGLAVALAALHHPDRFARDGALEIIIESGRIPELEADAAGGDEAARVAVETVERWSSRSVPGNVGVPGQLDVPLAEIDERSLVAGAAVPA